MWKLNKPVHPPSKVLLACISNYENDDLKKRLTSCKSAITAASELFEDKVMTTSLHTLPIQSGVNGIVTTDEMKKLYTDKMAKKNQPGRAYYDSILAAPKNGRCPLCGQGKVSSLDHHLPKAKYPALAITPSNLVPACNDCNKLKTSTIPTTAEQETIHPYFDDIESERWLFAKVVKGTPPTLKFYVRANSNWDTLKNKRVENHFKNFNLATLYAPYAAEEISLHVTSWLTIYEATERAAGPSAAAAAVQAQLLDSASSCRKVRLNSWQTATYEALANSNWFCSEGLKKVF